MNELENFSFEKLYNIYQKYFSLKYINSKFENKLAVIALTCYITNALRKQGKKVNCYDVLQKIGSNFSNFERETFLKPLAVVCEDMMYGCSEYPTFGVSPKEMPAQLKQLLANYCPF